MSTTTGAARCVIGNYRKRFRRYGYAVTHARLLDSLIAGFARLARVSLPAPSARALPTERRSSDFSHAVVKEVVRQVPHARVAVPALDVLVVRPDDDARRGFAHEQTDIALPFGSHRVGRSRQTGSVNRRGVSAESAGRKFYFRRGFLSMSPLPTSLCVCLRRWQRKRTFLPATMRSSDWMNMYFVPPKCTPPACSSEGSSMPATILRTSSGETCVGGRLRRQISSRVQRIKSIQRSSTRPEGTHFEPGRGGPNRAVHAADSALRDVPGPDQVVVDVRLPAHAEGVRELLTSAARGFVRVSFREGAHCLRARGRPHPAGISFLLSKVERTSVAEETFWGRLSLLASDIPSKRLPHLGRRACRPASRDAKRRVLRSITRGSAAAASRR